MVATTPGDQIVEIKLGCREMMMEKRAQSTGPTSYYFAGLVPKPSK